MTNYPNRNNTNTNHTKPSFLDELQSQCIVSIPTIAGLVFYKLPWMISLHFAGALGAESLAAAALATTLCNVTGLSFSVGLSSAITTLTGQARGHLLKKGQQHGRNDTRQDNGGNDCDDEETNMQTAGDSVREVEDSDHESNDIPPKEKEEKTPLLTKSSKQMKTYSNINISNTSTDDTNETTIGSTDDDDASSNSSTDNIQKEPLLPLIFLYRGIIIQLGIVIPIGIWWIKGIEPLLLFLGQAEHLSIMTTTYLRILTPGLWSYSINWTVTAWLQSIEMADVPAYAALVGFIFHVPFNVLYVNVLGFGYKGVAMATVSFQLLQPILIFVYLFGTKQGQDRILSNTGGKAVGRKRITFWPEVHSAVSFSGVKQYLELGTCNTHVACFIVNG